MLAEVILENFKCFKRHVIPLKPTSVIVGRNNAGKSTIVEALRLISLVTNRWPHLQVREVPSWLDIPRVNRGVSPGLSNQNFDFDNVFHRYGNPPARIQATFTTGLIVTIHIGGPERVHAVVKDPVRGVLGKSSRARLYKVGILPQIRPLQSSETILMPDYVSQNLSSNLASSHFRNQINLLFDETFAEFKAIAESTWPGLVVDELRGRGGRHGLELKLLVRNEDFVAEVGWMGHGLQMWLQTMWFLARCKKFETVILDEPDVYMHADLQRRLIRFLRGRHPQVILATHSIEIMSEVEPENILVVDRDRRQAQFTTDVPEVQRVIDQIGGIQNLQLARLWGAHKCLFLEGKDLSLLKQVQNKLFPASSEPIDAIPSMQVGGWSGWPYAVGSSMLLKRAVGQDINSYCILDSDFHTPTQIAGREAEAREKGLSLHIWRRKELENYLLVPDTIHRLLAKRMGHRQRIPTAQELGERLFQLAGNLKDEVVDAFAVEFNSENRRAGLTFANRLARDRIRESWESAEGRLSIVSGKMLLSNLSQWLQMAHRVSISPAAILHEMSVSEIADEVILVVTAIEYGDPF